MRNKTFSDLYQKAIIIDDEPDTCLLLGMVLKRFGITPLWAHTLAEGLQKTKEEQPTLIFLDNNLPDGSGIDQIKVFRQAAPASKLFMITAMAHLYSTAMQSGADGFVEKPLDLQKIESLINKPIEIAQ